MKRAFEVERTEAKLDLVSRGFRDADSTQALSDQATADAIAKILEPDLEAISRAAKRRQEGTYGLCENCRAEIGEERLSVLPDATLCVKCQTAWDQQARR